MRAAPQEVGGRAALMQLVFESSNDAIFLVDAESLEILDANPRATELLGYSRHELASVPLSLIHPRGVDRLAALVTQVDQEGKGWIRELECVGKDGARIPVEMSASVVGDGRRRLMVSILRDRSESVRLARERDYLAEELESIAGFGAIVGTSDALASALGIVERVAQTDTTVLVTGESGTGKELIARAVHDRSRRAAGPFVRVNCPAVPAELFESEFFGHVRGAFTGARDAREGRFELADGGTLFLDEIGEIPLGLQSKLLRVLQEGEIERVGESRTRRVDVRVVAATNRDLAAEVRAGRFREDLYYRLAIVPVALPPLRERAADIPALARHFIAEIARRCGIAPPPLTDEDTAALVGYAWPGNVRELKNVLERAVILAEGGRLRLELGGRPGVATAAPSSSADPDAMTLEDVKALERAVVRRALAEAQGRVYGPGGAAERLGLPPTTLASRLKRMGLDAQPRTAERARS